MGQLFYRTWIVALKYERCKILKTAHKFCKEEKSGTELCCFPEDVRRLGAGGRRTLARRRHAGRQLAARHGAQGHKKVRTVSTLRQSGPSLYIGLL